MFYIIEHMEDGFSEWVTLEYAQILKEIGPDKLILTSLRPNYKIPQKLLDLGLRYYTTSDLSHVHDEFPELPPLKGAATTTNNNRVCLLDPRATVDLQPNDALQFDYFVFGGILGDHPPRDRTSELMKAYPNMLTGRRLGDKQMTTDTAIRTTQLIIEQQIPFNEIKFIDYPEFRFNEHEATEMPFRYVLDETGRPVLPEGMLDLIKRDSEQSLDDLL